MNDTMAPEEAAYPRLSEPDIAALSEMGTKRQVQDGDPLFRAGEPGGGFFVVLSGAVEVLDRSGEEARTVAIHQPGEFTGDIDILTRRRTLVSAVARGDTELLHVPSSEIRRVMDERPSLGDVILRAFIVRRQLLMESGFQGLRVIGPERSRECFALRDFLDRNQVPSTFLSLESEPDVGELLKRLGVSERDLPVVVYGSQPLLRNPSIQRLAEAIGLKRPLREKRYDLAIVGAGPAGLAAAVYGSSEGVRTLVIDGYAPGGQAGASTKIENYLGFPTGITGAELMGAAVLQAQKFGAEFTLPCRVVELDLAGELPVLALEDGARIESRCVLIATGAEYRKLDAPGREKFDGMGVYYAATQTELSLCQNSEVAVVGGGNSAGQAIMYLSQHTRKVRVLLRGNDLRKSMSSYLAGRIEAAENCEVMYNTEIARMLGEEHLEAIEVENKETGERTTFPVAAVFSFIGADPHTGWLPDQIERNTAGFIRTGRALAKSPHWDACHYWQRTTRREPFLLETSFPGVFAAGDVRAGSIKRVSSAVGEGAMAVKYIHEHLAGEEAE